MKKEVMKYIKLNKYLTKFFQEEMKKKEEQDQKEKDLRDRIEKRERRRFREDPEVSFNPPQWTLA